VLFVVWTLGQVIFGRDMDFTTLGDDTDVKDRSWALVDKCDWLDLKGVSQHLP